MSHTTNQLPEKYIYILEYVPEIKINVAQRGSPLQTLFQEEASVVGRHRPDPEHLMVWIQYSTGTRELLNKKAAREHWQRLVNDGWVRVDK